MSRHFNRGPPVFRCLQYPPQDLADSTILYGIADVIDIVVDVLHGIAMRPSIQILHYLLLPACHAAASFTSIALTAFLLVQILRPKTSAVIKHQQYPQPQTLHPNRPPLSSTSSSCFPSHRHTPLPMFLKLLCWNSACWTSTRSRCSQSPSSTRPKRHAETQLKRHQC